MRPTALSSHLCVHDEARKGAGVENICADGARIPNMGEKLVRGITDEGTSVAVNFQVAAVDKPLIAISKLTEAGHDVQFTKEGGDSTHKATGNRTFFSKKSGVYVIRLWVRKQAEQRQMEIETSGARTTSSGGSRP